MGAVRGLGRAGGRNGAVACCFRAGHPAAGVGHAGDVVEGVHRLRGRVGAGRRCRCMTVYRRFVVVVVDMVMNVPVILGESMT